MILTGSKIEGLQLVQPFNKSQLNVNSYDVTLGDTIYHLTNVHGNIVDPFKESSYPKATVLNFENGCVTLKAGELYLGCTKETTSTTEYVPMIEGKSSLARLGIEIHLTAGFGDIGFRDVWTLEIRCQFDTILYSNMRIGQAYFIKPKGDIEEYYAGKYRKITKLPQMSKYYLNEPINF
jgi:dCTP deaminase